jgi:hypothetical protein
MCRRLDGLRTDGWEPRWLLLPVALDLLLDLAEPAVARFGFFSARRRPCFWVHFMTYAASTSNSVMICSRVRFAHTAARIFWHEGLVDFASAGPARATRAAATIARLGKRVIGLARHRLRSTDCRGA